MRRSTTMELSETAIDESPDKVEDIEAWAAKYFVQAPVSTQKDKAETVDLFTPTGIGRGRHHE